MNHLLSFRNLTLLSILSVLCLTLSFAQGNQKPPITPGRRMNVISTDGNTNTAKLTTQPQPQPKDNPVETQVIQELHSARISGDIQRQRELEQKLKTIQGSSDQPTQQIEVQGGPVKNDGNPQDYNMSQVNSLDLYGSAVCTIPTGAANAGRIWVVTAGTTTGTGDTLHYYYSSNNGASWVNAYIVYFTGINATWLPDDIQLIPIPGPNNYSTYLWLTASYLNAATNRKEAVWVRINQTLGDSLTGGTLQFPGFATTTNNYYHARCCTDATVYGSGAYVYMICSFDSLYSGSTHWLRQKFAICQNPLASAPTITYNEANGGGFWWQSGGQAANLRLWSDIGYFNCGGSTPDVFMTVYNYSDAGNNNFYMAFSHNYGGSSPGPGSFVLTETNFSEYARIAFNGGSYLTGMITYTRLFSSTDYDIYYWHTNNAIDTTAASWTNGTIDYSTLRARTSDVRALWGANNLFACSYAQDNPTAPSAWYAYYNGSSWTSNPYVVSNMTVDTLYGTPRAGYTANSGDNCLTVWSGWNGFDVYNSILCGTTLGVNNNNNEIPKSFALQQNYPNPFNPSTIIRFSLPGNEYVKVVVYDITGKQVSEIINQQLQAGSYSYNFDASNLSSGVYFYKITAGSFTDTKKMVLMK